MTLDWIDPIALVALGAAAGPILVHFLRRQRAVRVPFPSLQFLTPSRAAAVRVKAPADLWLLLLRIAIVAAAAVAWAQPVLMTDARRKQRERLVARAVVLDTSPSMAALVNERRDAALAERGSASTFIEIESADVRQGLRVAVARLKDAALARREIVLLSDFQHGTVEVEDLTTIPADIGIRFVPVRSQRPLSSPGPFRGAVTFGVAGRAATAQTIELRGARTAVTLTAAAEAPRAPRLLVAGNARADGEALLRVVASAGAPAMPVGRSVAIVCAGGQLPRDVSSPREEWMLRAIVLMRADGAFLDAVRSASEATAIATDPPWVVIARNDDGTPVAAVAASGAELIAQVAAPPSAFVTAAALRSLLVAIADRPSWVEHEVAYIPATRLQAWTRAPGPIPPDRWERSAPGDARWCWAVVLLLLGVETFVRRARHQTLDVEETVRAA